MRLVVETWEVRKQNLYGEDTNPSQHQCQTLAGDPWPVIGVGGLRAFEVRYVRLVSTGAE